MRVRLTHIHDTGAVRFRTPRRRNGLNVCAAIQAISA